MATSTSTTSSQSTVQLTAWADIANNVGAMVYLVVNGVRVGEPQYVTAGRWSGQPAQNLTFTFDTPEKVNSIAIEFANDMVDGGNRSLYIDALKVNGVALTASEATLVTPWGNTDGTWNVWYNAKLTYDTSNRTDIFTPGSGVVRNGTDGAETLNGTAYADILNGAGGNDTLIGGAGNDQLTGGLGADLFRIGKSGGADTITDFNAAQGDLIDLTGTGITGLDKLQITSSGGSRVIGLGDGTTVTLSSGTAPQANWFKFDPLPGGGDDPGGTQSTVRLSAWADVANGVGALVYLVVNGVRVGEPQYVTAGRWSGQPAQNVTFTFDTPANVQSIALEFANDMVDGGNRSLYVNSLSVNGVALSAGEATLVTPWGDTNGTFDIWYNAKLTYDMTSRPDIFQPVPGVVKNGTEGADSLTGAAGPDTLNGAGGNDTLIGGDGRDSLIGGAGDDLLIGNAGNDMLRGDAGADTFRFSKGDGQDNIADFNAAQGDLIDLTGTGITGLDKLLVSSSGTTHTIGLGDGTTITLTSTTAPQANWFKFDAGGGGAPSGGADGIFTWEGMSMPLYFSGRTNSSGADATYQMMKDAGANTVTLIPNFFMTNETSSSVYLDVGAESDSMAQFQAGVAYAASKGLQVVVKPHVETDNRVWRALIEPTDPSTWFQSYKNMMVEYAKAAQAGGAAMFVVGTEMKSMTDPTKFTSDGKSYTQHWGEIIDAVRTVFSGKVTYAATDEEAMKVQFWDKVDYIGVDAYFSMTNSNNPTVQELVNSWITPNHPHPDAQRIYGNTSVVDTWKNLSEQYDKKVIFTEIGYGSYDGVNKSPGWIASSVVDVQEQRDAYDALYQVIKNYGGQWLDGAFLWQYHPFADPSSVGVEPTDYETRGKPAQAVIKEGYSSPEHVPGLVWNGTSSNNKLDGGYNNDTVNGAGGNDTLWGGRGDDILSGGAGADRFDFGSGSGKDAITDFDVASAGEVIAIAANVNGLSLSNFTQLMARTTTVGADAMIDLGSGNSIKVTGVTKAQLTADDFLFI